MGRLCRRIKNFIRDHRNVKISSIKSMKLIYTVGCFMNADIRYGISYEDGKYIAYVKPKLKSSEETRTFTVDEAFVEEIRVFLSDMGVGAWNGFKKVDKRVCDGRNFDFHLETEEGQVRPKTRNCTICCSLATAGTSSIPISASVRSGL